MSENVTEKKVLFLENYSFKHINVNYNCEFSEKLDNFSLKVNELSFTVGSTLKYPSIRKPFAMNKKGALHLSLIHI